MTKTITFTIKLLEPTLVTSLDGDPNSAVSFKYLPGSVLRGMVIGQYMRQHELEELNVADPEICRLFFNGSVRYLNAYPVDRLGQRALPTPCSWYQEKEKVLLETRDEPAGVYDLFSERPKNLELKKATKPFVTRINPQQVRWVIPQSQLTVHTHRDRKKGRSTKQSGDIFQYEALSPGQVFEAAILCENDQDVERIKKYIPKRLTIGGSRNAGYGRIEIDVNKSDKNNWPELTSNEDAEDQLVIIFASDALIRNSSGQYVTDPEVLTATIAKRLDCSLTLQQSFITAKPIGGFNRKWGLPLPQVTAVGMGSVLVFDRPDDWPTKKLNALLWQGIGERRIDGFGRVVVDWQMEAILKVEGRVAYKSQNPKIEDVADRTLAQQMANRQLHQQLEYKLVSYVNEIVKNKLPVKNSQLSRLRLIVQNALLQPPKEGRERLLAYLAKLDKRQATRSQFSRAQIESENFWDWLNQRTRNACPDEKEDEKIKITSIEDKLKLSQKLQIGDVEAKWTEDLRYEYNLRLIDAVLAQAIKLADKEDGK